MDHHSAVCRALAAGCLLLAGAAVPVAAEMPADRYSGAPIDITGTWKMMFQFTDCATGLPLPTRPAFPTLNVFFADGNVIENSSGLSPSFRTISQGRWQQIGKRTVIARSELQLFENSPTYTGYQVLERTFTLSVDGNELASSVAWRRFNTVNAPTAQGCATETGIRQPEPTPAG